MRVIFLHSKLFNQDLSFYLKRNLNDPDPEALLFVESDNFLRDEIKYRHKYKNSKRYVNRDKGAYY